MTHSSVPAETRRALGITDNLIRLSVGVESTIDLLRDLDRALAIAVRCTTSLSLSRRVLSRERFLSRPCSEFYSSRPLPPRLRQVPDGRATPNVLDYVTVPTSRGPIDTVSPASSRSQARSAVQQADVGEKSSLTQVVHPSKSPAVARGNAVEGSAAHASPTYVFDINC